MDKEPMEAAGINAYELQDQFDTIESKELHRLRKDIARQYQGDGEFQASETSDQILEGDSAAELNGANTESDSQNKSKGKG